MPLHQLVFFQSNLSVNQVNLFARRILHTQLQIEHAFEKQSAYQSLLLWEGLDVTLPVYNHASVENVLFLKRFPFQFNLSSHNYCGSWKQQFPQKSENKIRNPNYEPQ